MGMIDNPFDPRQEDADLFRRLSQLNRTTMLNNASITESPGLSVATPEGVTYKPGSSQSMEPASGGKPAASIKFGTAGKLEQSGDKIVSTGKFEATEVGAGGTKIGSDGKIGSTLAEVEVTKPLRAASFKSVGNIDIDGNLTTEGYVSGRNGVWTPWQGSRTTVESILNGIKSTADSAKSATDNQGPRITTLENWRTAAAAELGNKATVASVTAVKNKQGELVDRINAIDAQMNSFHPSKPIYPPIVKG